MLFIVLFHSRVFNTWLACPIHGSQTKKQVASLDSLRPTRFARRACFSGRFGQAPFLFLHFGRKQDLFDVSDEHMFFFTFWTTTFVSTFRTKTCFVGRFRRKHVLLNVSDEKMVFYTFRTNACFFRRQYWRQYLSPRLRLI